MSEIQVYLVVACTCRAGKLNWFCALHRWMFCQQKQPHPSKFSIQRYSIVSFGQYFTLWMGWVML